MDIWDAAIQRVRQADVCERAERRERDPLYDELDALSRQMDELRDSLRDLQLVLLETLGRTPIVGWVLRCALAGWVMVRRGLGM